MFNVNTVIETQALGTFSSSSNSTNRAKRPQHSQFHEHKLIEKYCKQTNLAEKIKETFDSFLLKYTCTRKPEEALAPLVIRLDFEFTELVKHGQQLLYLAVREPLQFADAVKYSVYEQLRELLKSSSNTSDRDGLKSIDIAQLHTQWRLLGLPQQPNLFFRPTKYKCPLGLSVLLGILSAYTPPEILVLQSIWYCGSGCMRNGIQTSSTEAPLCPNCQRPMSEYQKLRVTENYRLLAILPSACAQTPREVNRIYRPILVRSRDHTYDCELKLGAIYQNVKSGRARPQPVQLCDFLRADTDEAPIQEQSPPPKAVKKTPATQLSNKASSTSFASILSQVSPIVSSRESIQLVSQQEHRSTSDGSCQNVNKDKSISFVPNEEDFPAVGAIRSKKAKLSPAALAAKSKQSLPNNAEINATETATIQRSSATASNHISKNVLVNKWLTTVQHPNAGNVSQQTTANPSQYQPQPQQQQQQQHVAVRFHQQPLLQHPPPSQATVISQQPLLQQPLVHPQQHQGVFQLRQQQQQPPPACYGVRAHPTSTPTSVRQHFVDVPTNPISMSAPTPPSHYKFPHIVQYQQQQQQLPTPAPVPAPAPAPTSVYNSGGQYAASAPLVQRAFHGSSANVMVPTTQVKARRAPTPVSTPSSQPVYNYRQLGAPHNIRGNMTAMQNKNINVPQVSLPARSVQSTVQNSGLSHDQYTRFSNDSRIQRKMSWKNQQCIPSNQSKSNGSDTTGEAFFAANSSPPSSWSSQQLQSPALTKSPYKSQFQQSQAQSQSSESQSQSEFQSVSQSQLEAIASCSTLNWNANEFHPKSQKSSPTDENRPKNISMISERRRRQRFYRTLKPHAMFELVSLPTEPPLESATSSLNPMCASFIVPRSETALSATTGHTFGDVSQSDFRHTSLGTSLDHDAESVDTPNGRTLLNMDPTPQQPEKDFFIELSDKQTHESNDNMSLREMSLHPPQTEAVRPLKVFAQGNAKYYGLQVDMNFVPPNIKRLYRTICDNFSDYAFVYALSAQLCQESVPMECFVYLKMALLCSLASFEASEVRAPISLCVICNDGRIAHNLLENMGQLAQRFVGSHEGVQQQAFSALPTRHNWVQATPLLMAQQGVYYAGDWNRLSRDQAEELEKCIENGSVTIPLQQTAQLLETAIWTYWQPENAVNQATAFAKLCPIFGMPVYMGEHGKDTMCDFVLRKHSVDEIDLHLKKDPFLISTEDMRMLLEIIHQREVVFTERAEHLLKKYYIVSRVLQPTAFSSKTYVVLKQFAESLAKLALRLNVMEQDVIGAIFHCEHYVRKIFGAGDFPPPAVSTLNVIAKVDTSMNLFTRWLYQYLDRYEKQAVL